MLFTFPSQYWFTIGLSLVFSLTGWSRPIHAEFLVLRATQDTATLHVASHTGLSPSMRSYYPREAGTSLVWALPRSLATTGGIIVYFLFLRVLRCFSSPRSPQLMLIACLQHAGLSHSEIPGSMVICTSPELIAAYHVLHRL